MIRLTGFEIVSITPRMTLKKQLRLYLEHHDMTAAQLSRKSKVSQQVLSLWLKGGEPKRMTQVKQVASVLGTSVDHLCFGNGVEAEESPTLDTILGDEWLSGLFEIKIRRVKK